MRIRLALDTDVPRIKEISGVPQAIEWDEVYPHWLVAETNGEVVGCLNIAPSKPFGYIDQLAVDESLGSHTRAKAVRALIQQAMMTLNSAGCRAVIALIPFERKGLKRVLKKHFGAQVMTQGNIIVGRL